MAKKTNKKQNETNKTINNQEVVETRSEMVIDETGTLELNVLPNNNVDMAVSNELNNDTQQESITDGSVNESSYIEEVHNSQYDNLTRPYSIKPTQPTRVVSISDKPKKRFINLDNSTAIDANCIESYIIVKGSIDKENEYEVRIMGTSGKEYKVARITKEKCDSIIRSILGE